MSMLMLSEGDTEFLTQQANEYQVFFVSVMSLTITFLAECIGVVLISSGGDGRISSWNDQQGRVERYLGEVPC